MDFYKLFYFLTLGDRLSSFIWLVALLLSIVWLILFLASVLLDEEEAFEYITNKKGNDRFKEDEQGNLVPTAKSSGGVILYKGKSSFRLLSGWKKIIMPLTIFLWLLYLGIPSKKDAVLIIGGGYVGNFISQDSSAKQLPSDIVYFIRSNLQKYAEEAQVEIRGFTNTKTLADSLKEMSKEEITNYILNKTR